MSGFTDPDRGSALVLWAAIALMTVVLGRIAGCLP